MGRLFMATVSFVALIAVIITGFWFQINNYTTLEISTRLPVLLSPAVYAYFILIFIYACIAYWIFSYWKKYKTSESMTILQSNLFLLTNILHIVSILSWHYLQFTVSLVTFVLLIATLATLYFTYPFSDQQLSSRIPVSIYFAWALFVMMTNTNFVLTLNEWNGFGLSYPLWSVIALTLGTAIAMHVRYHYFDIAFPAILIWCYIAVAVHNGFEELLVTTASLFLSGVMFVGIVFMKKNPATQ